ncbi:MAG TPA: preprotein translocase subunit SecE, partial [Dehalococcoidia bacterium]|nr:preprotein translocase subunit SecE [Dehalococcoidia bacterium]
RRGLRVPSFVEDIYAELRKVTWPTWAETRYLTQVVIIVAISVGIALGVIDIFFNWLIDRLLLQ